MFPYREVLKSGGLLPTVTKEKSFAAFVPADAFSLV